MALEDRRKKGLAVREKIKGLRPTNIKESLQAAAVLASTIPTIGGLLSGIVMNTASSRRWQRLLTYLESIEDRLNYLGSPSDDQEEIVVEILERVIKERSEEKTDCYRNILLNALSSSNFDYDRTLEMVKLVERLTANHMKVLRVISDPVAARAKIGDGVYLERPVSSIARLPAIQLGLYFVSSYFPKWPSGQLSRIWGELCDCHVIHNISPRVDMPLVHEMISIDMIALSLSQYITEYGHDFICYVLTLDVDQA